MSETLLTILDILWWRETSFTAPRDFCCQGCAAETDCHRLKLWCDNAIVSIMAGQEWMPPEEWPKLN